MAKLCFKTHNAFLAFSSPGYVRLLMRKIINKITDCLLSSRMYSRNFFKSQIMKSCKGVSLPGTKTEWKNSLAFLSEMKNAKNQTGLLMRVGVNEWRGIERTQTTQYADLDKMDMKQRDGGRQEKRVWCYANGSLVLLLRWAALAQETMSEKERAVTLQKQGRRRSETALHARMVLLTAHQESR